MEKELVAIEKFMLSLKDARTRCGVSFTCSSYDIGQNRDNTKALGEVYIKRGENGDYIPIAIKWSLDGIASLGPDFDLITEEPFGR